MKIIKLYLKQNLQTSLHIEKKKKKIKFWFRLIMKRIYFYQIIPHLLNFFWINLNVVRLF